MARHRIFWTQEEIAQVGDEFIRMRQKDPFQAAIAVLLEAQGVLDPDRQRPSNTLSAFQLVVDYITPRWAKLFEAKPVPAVATPAPVAEVIAPKPLPVAEPVAAPATPSRPSEPLVIEIRAEKTDALSLLISLPTPLLLGAALERLMAMRTQAAPAHEVVRVETHPKTAPVVAAPPPPPLIKEDSVVGAPAEANGRRVLVLGLLPSAVELVRTKTASFANLDISIIDASRQDQVGSVQCDWLIMSREMLTHFQAAQIRKRFTDPSRIIHFEGTTEQLMVKLADLNSRVR